MKRGKKTHYVIGGKKTSDKKNCASAIGSLGVTFQAGGGRIQYKTGPSEPSPSNFHGFGWEKIPIRYGRKSKTGAGLGKSKARPNNNPIPRVLGGKSHPAGQGRWTSTEKDGEKRAERGEK